MLKHVHCYQENGNWYMSFAFEISEVLNTHQASIMDLLTNEVIVDDILEVKDAPIDEHNKMREEEGDD